MSMFVGSPDGCVLTSLDWRRFTLTPGSRCSDSEADLSGNAPISVAVTESTKVGAIFLICCDVKIACFTPTTTTSCRGRCSTESVGRPSCGPAPLPPASCAGRVLLCVLPVTAGLFGCVFVVLVCVLVVLFVGCLFFVLG